VTAPKKPLIEQIIDQSGLSNVIKLLPGRPWFQVADILALSNVLVLTSVSETWGLVVNEAMVCGLPVIVSDRCGCVPELVHHGENGFVFDPNEPAQLTYQLTQFMNDTINVDQMSRLARQSIESYSPEVVAQEMLAGFIKVTG
jgi:glycosyltransferase involved in cell wall biosynthesis